MLIWGHLKSQRWLCPDLFPDLVKLGGLRLTYFFLAISFFLTQAHAMRLCSVSLKFFNFFLSTTLSNVSTKCLNQFWWNLVTMTNDQARRCPMTFDPVKGYSRSKGSKINIFSKTHQVHQVSWYVHNTHTHDSLQCPLQKLSDSKFIRGHLGSQLSKGHQNPKNL